MLLKLIWWLQAWQAEEEEEKEEDKEEAQEHFVILDHHKEVNKLNNQQKGSCW